MYQKTAADVIEAARKFKAAKIAYLKHSTNANEAELIISERDLFAKLTMLDGGR